MVRVNDDTEAFVSGDTYVEADEEEREDKYPPPSRLVADDEQDTEDNTHYNMGYPTVADKEYTRLVTIAD